ncbi:MAG TPA: LuxR family transcriptional regulator [Paracoccaceae bacterium]|nr:LuxR family transcriptional regulator [Paracoccaceae bacterium]
MPTTARIKNFLEILHSATSIDGLQSAITRFRSTYEVDHVVYHSVSGTGQQYAALTYDPDWVDHYISMGYEKIDPVVQGALQAFHPFDWKSLDWSGKAKQAFLKEAIAAGVGTQGYSVPIRGPHGQFALFSINSTQTDAAWQNFTKEHAEELLLLAHYIHDRASFISEEPSDISPRELSPREKDALSLLGTGIARAKIAEKMSISEHTLRVYIDSARYKLGATNTTHAVALAISRGIVLL